MTSGSAHRRAIICTGNPHKVEELGELLAGLDFAFSALPADAVLPPETADSFVGNARIKAEAGHDSYPDAWVIADDSGLIVDALDGAPGVWSARFAGDGASDQDNVDLLLERLAGTPDAERTARFACVLVAIAPDGSEHVAEGFVEGVVARAPAGDSGFGYDPVFVPLGHTESFAELGSHAKAQLSHRAHAAQALRDQLGELSA
ncbi:MAG: RdgB/HAM1 family non-canonical purine NTP pyrophosphatase [Thermoleophilia bacterium]|nr:RdgB/HAM1 family non-canonical purine NTP pyrophosphatase [Thermoleophilia bacterium]